ncbi:MAG: DUF3108 domain-containing protein [Candidatus Methylacidiphilales bacterium]|nr:DUF3108 domain-containing protein [Candidatus Methylacidiphilales bacterium]
MKWIGWWGAWVLWVPGICPAGVVPWAGGETMHFEVHWGMVVAAEAVVAVTPDAEGWRAEMELKSRGLVETLCPIRSRWVSRFSPGAERSYGLEADRKEGGREKRNRLVLDADLRRGVFTNLLEQKEKVFELPDDNCQDILSMFFAARAADWTAERVREWDVGEEQRLKRVHIELVEDEVVAGPDGTDRACLVLVVREMADRKGHLPDKPLRMRIWVEKEGLRPLRAQLSFVYGTFRISRVDAPEAVAPAPRD